MKVLNPIISNLSLQYEDYYARGQYANSLDVARKLLDVAEQSNVKTEKMLAYLKLMHSYYSLGEIENAFEMILQFRVLCDEINHKKTEFYINFISGYIFEFEELYDQAVISFEKALNIALELKEKNLIANSRNLYSHLLIQAGKAKEAYESAKIGYQFVKENLSENLLTLCHSQHILSNALIENEQFQEAFEMLNKLTKNPIISYNKKERSRYLFTYGYYYLKTNKIENAITYFKKAEEIAFQNNDTILLKRIYKNYANIYAHLQDYKQAFIHMQNYVHLLEQTLRSSFTSKTREIDIKQHAFASERKANIDSLSGLYNRSYLEHTTNAWLADAKKDGDHVCCIIFDVDNFKTINDTYGHLYGDEVIKHIGECCRNVFSTSNALCSRYGGDEFVIVLRNFGRDKINEATQQLFRDVTSKVIKFNQTTINITISMGVVCNGSFPSKRFTQLFRVADQALYMAKRQGKNQIVTMSNSSCKM